MNAPNAVNAALAAEAAVLTATLAILVGRVWWRQLRARRRGPQLAAGRAALLHVLHGAAPGPELTGLPPALAQRLVLELAGSMHGARHATLAQLADELGLVDRAERWCTTRRWWRRLHGARILTLVGGGEAVVPRLGADAHPEVRAQVAWWAVRHVQAETVALVLDLLDDAEPLCRFAARDALVRIGRPAVAPLAARLAATGDAVALASALEVAASLADPRLLPPALRLCRHADPQVRAAAAAVAGALGGAAAVAACSSARSSCSQSPTATAPCRIVPVRSITRRCARTSPWKS